jgi:hypothetical protein
VWVFARHVRLRHAEPGRDARGPYLVRAVLGATALGAAAWWALHR